MAPTRGVIASATHDEARECDDPWRPLNGVTRIAVVMRPGGLRVSSTALPAPVRRVRVAVSDCGAILPAGRYPAVRGPDLGLAAAAPASEPYEEHVEAHGMAVAWSASGAGSTS